MADRITPSVADSGSCRFERQGEAESGFACSAYLSQQERPIASGTTLSLPVMGESEVDSVRQLENMALLLPQVHITTNHVFHAGMYARTIKIPAGIALTGAQIKIPTILIISGDALVYGGNGATRYTGYQVALGQCGRKQAFYALQDTYLTMLFPTSATTIDEAERQFTDEHEKLFSRKECA